MKSTSLFLVIGVAVSVTLISYVQSKTVRINPTKAQNCGAANSPVEFKEVKVRAVALGKYSISGFVIIRTSLQEPLVLREKMERCKSASDVDSCSTFMDLSVVTLCDRIKEENKVWSGFFEHLEGFDTNCPIKPGTYTLNNYTYNQDDFPITAAKGYWKSLSEIETVGLKGKEVLGCFQAEIDIQVIE